MQPVPVLQSATAFDSQKLRTVLRFCPFSNFFGTTSEVLRMKLPKKRHLVTEVSKMVIEWCKIRESNLSEVEE